MKIIRSFFCDMERYHWDFGPCSSRQGFAQVDTGQDASYFGTWANPFTLKIVSYTEGDLTTEEAASPKEFTDAMVSLRDWNEESGHGFKGIDPMGNAKIEAEFTKLGLADLLH